MKILFLTPGCFDKGGISRYGRYQITALRELFDEKNIRVLSLLGPEEDSFEEPFDVTWYAGRNSFWQQIRFIWQTLWQILTWRPSIIHIAHVNFSGFVYLFAKLFGIKTVLNVYGLEVWSRLSKDAALGLRKVDFVISDCHYTANYLEQERYRKRDSITVIWDCVDLERFYPAESNQKVRKKFQIPDQSGHFIIMSLGRLSKSASHKGYDRLINVFQRLAIKYENTRLVIGGKGDNKETYEEMVRSYNLTDKVIFTGMVEDKELPDLYRCASVFSLVSDRGIGRGEGIPLTPLEAMACGIPVIVGNQDGSQEAVMDNLNGSVIDPFNLEKHVEVLEALLCSPELLKEKSRFAANIACTHFSYVNFKNKHKDFYSHLS